MAIEAGLVRKAHHLFLTGEYEQAKKIYTQLTEQYGQGLFDANIKLCVARSDNQSARYSELNLHNQAERIQLQQQLQQTQQQLELYYQKYQDLQIRIKEQS